MYYRESINFVTLEEDINILLREEKIYKLRNGLTDFVSLRLENRALRRMKEAGIDEAMEEAFLRGDKARTEEFYAILAKKETPEGDKDGLGLSQEKIRDIKRVARCNRKADPQNAENNAWEARENALEKLREILLAEENIRFPKEAGIAPKVWRDFRNCDKLTGEPTLQKIRFGLGLSQEEIMEFNSRVIVHVFAVDEAFREEVSRLRKATGMDLAYFQNYAYVGKEAWEAFYCPPVGSPPKNTTQKTLLKLVIGFGLEEDDAWDFMEKAKSAFVVRRDLVCLACVRCGYLDPSQVREILDFFAEGRYAERLYSNIYD